jgi:hypothetical protein
VIGTLSKCPIMYLYCFEIFGEAQLKYVVGFLQWQRRRMRNLYEITTR